MYCTTLQYLQLIPLNKKSNPALFSPFLTAYVVSPIDLTLTVNLSGFFVGGGWWFFFQFLICYDFIQKLSCTIQYCSFGSFAPAQLCAQIFTQIPYIQSEHPLLDIVIFFHFCLQNSFLNSIYCQEPSTEVKYKKKKVFCSHCYYVVRLLGQFDYNLSELVFPIQLDFVCLIVTHLESCLR